MGPAQRLCLGALDRLILLAFDAAVPRSPTHIRTYLAFRTCICGALTADLMGIYPVSLGQSQLASSILKASESV